MITLIRRRISSPSKLQQLLIHYQNCSGPTGQVDRSCQHTTRDGLVSWLDKQSLLREVTTSNSWYYMRVYDTICIEHRFDHKCKTSRDICRKRGRVT
uniref:Uncharacterized protein n=1 Tax=Fusarium oxysporum (strain Fo5176) TaxID=660025 RepID=A0A0D2YA89_FUSOF